MIKKDNIKSTILEEVVITGQLNPQSIKKSVFEVQVITQKEIAKRAGNNLADLLNQVLNLSIIPNTSNGKSELNVQGLDAKYFKVLIDNIPVINEEGFGNNTDLTLINLEDVERIELVKGAMGVQYGANALSGVINIITKKKNTTKWTVKTSLQEESVGKEYEWFEKGRHIQTASIQRKLTSNDFIRLGFNRNDFKGFHSDRKGKFYDRNDNQRGHKWFPKEQNNAKLLFSHKKDDFSFFYKFDYLYENIFDYDSIVKLNTNTATQISYPSSIDKKYTNQRFIHHLNFIGKIAKIPYTISFSYQKHQKDLEKYNYFIRKDKKEPIENGTYLSKQVWFSRGTFSNLINTKKVKLQAGYELTKESGYGSPFAITIENTKDAVRNELISYDVFSSSEILINKDFSVRPGIRMSFNSLFNTQAYYSLSARHLFTNDFEVRTILGLGNRTPNYNELYTYFVDVNHDVRGNKNLTPETGLSAFLHLKKTTFLTEEAILNNKVSISYIDVKDRIELITVNLSPLKSQYNNIDIFKSFGATFENNFSYKNIKAQLGGSVFGILKYIDHNKKNTSGYRYNYQLNATASYYASKLGISFSAYLKYLLQTNRFVEVGGAYEFQKINPYGIIDATLRKTFFNKKIETVIGVRNVLDVTEQQTNNVITGAHSGTSNTILLGYGRSYFLKLAYNINI